MLFAKKFLTLEGVIIFCVLMSHMKVTEDRVVGYKLLMRFLVPRKLFIKFPFHVAKIFFVPAIFPSVFPLVL